MYTSPSQPGIRSLSNCPHPLGGQPTAAALVRLRCRKALQVAVPTVHWRDEHVFNSCLPESCFLSYRDEISVGGKQSCEWGL